MVHYIGIIHKIGPIGSITTRAGDTKMRRNLIVCDDSNYSCVVCFWAEKHLEMLSNRYGAVIAIQAARVSDFSRKSLNAF